MNVELIFPERLRKAREASGLTQQQVARRAGISGRHHISLMELGRKLPTVPTLVKLALALEVSIDYLLGLTDTPQAAEGGALEQVAALLSPSNYQWIVGLAKVLIDEQKAMQARVEQRQVGLLPMWGNTG